MKNSYTTQGNIMPEKKSVLLWLVIAFGLVINLTPLYAQSTVVEKYGQLQVSGNRIVDQNGTAIQLRGMSLYWSQWVGKYYTYNSIKWLRDDFKVTVVRAAMGINGSTDGYLVNNTAEKNKIFAVIDAAIALGIYVIVDWHDHEAYTHQNEAKAFFEEVAAKYGDRPNILYEIYNEPKDYSWANTIKPYHEAVITSIRSKDPDNIIICGTRFYSQEVEEAADNRLSGTNIAYTLHFYSGTHKQALRDKAQNALNKGIALFVTEYGTTDASGNGTVDEAETNAWYTFCENNKLSYCNWSVADISESSAALNSGASPDGNWSLKQSGTFVRNQIRSKAPTLTTSAPLANGTYKITARNSGKALDVAGYSTQDNGDVVQWTYSGGDNQRWILQSLGDGSYSIKNKYSGKSLDLIGYNTADNTADINQYTYYGSNNQRWRLENLNNGYYKIVSIYSGKSIKIKDNLTTDGTGLTQQIYNGATSQQFAITQLSTATSKMALIPETGEVDNDIQITVYPNPSKSSFYIDIEEDFSYSLFDVTGKIVESGTEANKNEIGRGVNSGMYLLQITIGEEIKSIKLIKN